MVASAQTVDLRNAFRDLVAYTVRFSFFVHLIYVSTRFVDDPIMVLDVYIRLTISV